MKQAFRCVECWVLSFSSAPFGLWPRVSGQSQWAVAVAVAGDKAKLAQINLASTQTQQ